MRILQNRHRSLRPFDRCIHSIGSVRPMFTHAAHYGTAMAISALQALSLTRSPSSWWGHTLRSHGRCSCGNGYHSNDVINGFDEHSWCNWCSAGSNHCLKTVRTPIILYWPILETTKLILFIWGRVLTHKQNICNVFWRSIRI